MLYKRNKQLSMQSMYTDVTTLIIKSYKTTKKHARFCFDYDLPVVLNSDGGKKKSKITLVQPGKVR